MHSQPSQPGSAWLTSRKIYSALRVVVALVLTAVSGQAAELKSETLAAWNQYLSQEKQQVEHRAAAGDCFLWIEENPDLMKQIHDGSVAVEPFESHDMLHVPGGLIHHWIGAVFIPGSSVDDVLSVTRDYTHYKDFYKPGVDGAKLLDSSLLKDHFILRFVNNSVLSRTALEGTYTSEFFPLTEKRSYSISVTSGMEEIKDPDTPDEKRFLPGHGSGYIWRLYSTARMDERDGGVYLELEAIALSRDVPGTLRWIADPIVRRISRDSLEKSLNETAQAVRQHSEMCEQASTRQPATHDPIIVAGSCSHHVDYSSLWYQKLASNSGR